jgi:hypothetical protein
VPPRVRAHLVQQLVLGPLQAQHPLRAAGAARGDIARADIAITGEPNPCVQLPVIVPLVLERQNPFPMRAPLTVLDVEGVCALIRTLVATFLRGEEDRTPIR